MSPRVLPTRPAAAAGRFYPAPPAVLRVMLGQLDEQAAKSDAANAKAVIAPHAGYPFSGPVAASVFRLLRGRATPIRRVVLFGPAHYVGFTGLAVPSVGAFATPLGDVAVDRATVAHLLDLPGAGVNELDEPHAPEHALEVELPFLIDALGGADRFEIVPLLFSDADTDDAAAALGAAWGGEETLVVVSSDLSHYLDHDAAARLDRATADAIVANQPHAVGPQQACGHVAVRGLMRVAAERGLHCRCLDLRNSGDTAPHLGGRDRVVGYGAFLYT